MRQERVYEDLMLVSIFKLRGKGQEEQLACAQEEPPHLSDHQSCYSYIMNKMVVSLWSFYRRFQLVNV